MDKSNWPLAGSDWSLRTLTLTAFSCFENFLSGLLFPPRALFARFLSAEGRVEEPNDPSQTALTLWRRDGGGEAGLSRNSGRAGPRLAAVLSRPRDESRLLAFRRASRGRCDDCWQAHGSNWPCIAQHAALCDWQSSLTMCRRTCYTIHMCGSRSVAKLIFVRLIQSSLFFSAFAVFELIIIWQFLITVFRRPPPLFCHETF